MAGYEDTELYKLAKQMAVEIHKMTLGKLLELLHETESLLSERFQYFYGNYRKIGAMLYNLRLSIIKGSAY